MVKDLDYYMGLDYPISIRRLSDEEGGGYVVSIPLLGEHTFTAAGDTVEESLRILEDVKRDHFRRMLELGIEIPEPATACVSTKNRQG
jgi:predicted RNase H-like HicB family nuclease